MRQGIDYAAGPRDAANVCEDLLTIGYRAFRSGRDVERSASICAYGTIMLYVKVEATVQ